MQIAVLSQWRHELPVSAIVVYHSQCMAGLTPTAPGRTLEKLQDQAEPQLFEDTKRAVEREFHRPLEELFAEFDPDARAAASLAQVGAMLSGH